MASSQLHLHTVKFGILLFGVEHLTQTMHLCGVRVFFFFFQLKFLVLFASYNQVGFLYKSMGLELTVLVLDLLITLSVKD